MKHIFIINPFAGSGNGIAELKSKLEKVSFDYSVYETKCSGDATQYIRQYCESNSEPVRFYSCGGDGTAKEVAEGVVEFAHASMSIFPIGSGNDFVKYYGGEELFRNVDDIANADNEKIDIIQITHSDGQKTYSLNVCNFGFEAYAASVMNKVRRKPIIGGGNSYTTGVLCGLFGAMKSKGKIYADGKLLNESGKFLLCTVANGGYVGGGYNCAPRASVSDGELEVCLVRPFSVFTLARLIGVYKKGKHLDDPGFKKYITYCRAKKVELVTEKPQAVCIDGEIIYTTHFVAEVKDGAVNFAAPVKQ